MHHIGLDPPNNPAQLADTKRIRHGWVMGSATRVKPRQAHRRRREPVYLDTAGENFLVRCSGRALRRNSDAMTAARERVGEVKDVQLFAAVVRREELRQQQNPH
jgi:hypothetical protein